MIRPYIDLLKHALCNVERDYFHISTASEKWSIVRERVFCYELYHQVRLQMEDSRLLPIRVHAEIDKRGNQDFDGENPDFVFHKPGTHKCNTLVVEVKSRIDDVNGVQKDFRTLCKFIECHEYQAGAFVLFGRSFEDLERVIGEHLRGICRKPSTDRIYLLTIESARAKCEERVLSSICTT